MKHTSLIILLHVERSVFPLQLSQSIRIKFSHSQWGGRTRKRGATTIVNMVVAEGSSLQSHYQHYILLFFMLMPHGNLKVGEKVDRGLREKLAAAQHTFYAFFML